MANYATLKSAIEQVIKTNGNNEITGALLQQSLLAMINSLGAGYQFVGVAMPTTNPGTPDYNVFYIASTAGTYSNFNGLVVNDGEIAILKYNGTWTKDVTGAATAAQVAQLGQELNANMDGIGWSNTYLTTGAQSSRTANAKRVSNNAPFKVGTGNRLRITLQTDWQVMISYYQTATTDARSSYVGYTGVSGDYVAPKDYAILTFKKVTGGSDQTISPNEVYGQVSFYDCLSGKIEQFQTEGALVLNVSKMFPTGGTNGTNVYTKTAARQAVPEKMRVPGGILCYLTDAGFIMEQYVNPTYDSTKWVYGKWDRINLHDILNINEYSGSTDAFATRKDARATIPDFAKLKGQFILYKSIDGYHIEENLNGNGILNNNDQYFRQVLPISISLLKEPTILYEDFITLTSGSTSKIVSGITLVSKKTSAVVKISGLSGEFALLNSSYQRINNLVSFEDGQPFVVETSQDVRYLYIKYNAISADTGIHIMYCTDTVSSDIRSLSDSVTAEYENSFGKQWGERVSLGLQSLGTIQGDLSDIGQLVSSEYHRMSLNYIPVKTGSFIQTITTSWVYAIRIAFYKKGNDGSYGFVSFVDNNKMAFVPDGVTHCRFGFRISYPSSSVLTEELLEANYVINLITNSSLANPLVFKELFSNNPVLKISDYTDWVIGIAGTYTNEKMVNELPIKIIPGHRYRLELPMDNTHIDNAGWNYGETYDNISGWKGWLNGTPLTGRNFFFDAPAGAHYLRIQLSGEAGNIVPAEAENVIIVDVTGKNPFESVYKMINDWEHPGSYAQGMTIANGYIFQAFADGYIDIYDIETLSFVQSVFVPIPDGASYQTMHCNNLTFGEKYQSEDEFGILWVNSESANTPMVGIRVQLNNGVFTFTKLYEVIPPEVDETSYVGNDEFIDYANKRFVEVLYSTGYGDMTIRVYSYNTMTEDVQFELENTFTCAKLYPLQGGMLRDELLYLCVGSGGGNKACIYVFNIFSGEIVWILDLRKPKFNINDNEEIQGCAIYKNNLYFSTTYGFYQYSQS